MRQGGQDYMVGTASRKPQILKLMLKPQSPTARRPIIRAWLYAVAALMVLTLVVGGATRLTESGLSIVEWKPVAGVLPPVSQEAWQAEFGKYQQIPQYRELNRGMSRDEFKTIYWGEGSHRLLAPTVGAGVLQPFVVFLGRGAGLVFNTWPEIDGALIPAAERLWFETPVWRNLFENTLTVQFNHRMVAYLLWAAAMLHAIDVVRSRRGGAALNGALLLAS